MTNTALVLGEALIDVVHHPDGSQAEFPGGSPMNVAIGLARLGRETDLATWIGSDARGDVIAGHLADSGVTLVEGSRQAPHTSVAQAHLDPDGVASYTFDIEWQLPKLAVDTALVAHTGSIAATLAPGGGQVLSALTALHSTATITYDPNIRPALMNTPADTVPIVRSYLAIADVVKVSDEDLAWLYPSLSIEQVARDWLHQGPGLVVVTKGGEGALAALGNGELIEVAAPKVTVADTVGAGDSFMSGLIDGLWSAGLLGAERRTALRGAPPGLIQGVVQKAAQIAAITVSRPGANPPWATEI